MHTEIASIAKRPSVIPARRGSVRAGLRRGSPGSPSQYRAWTFRYFGGCGGQKPTIACLMVLLLVIAGCGEPSERELKNRRELEALLTAISLKNAKELNKDIKRIDERRISGELSDDSYRDLQEIAKKAQAGDWSGAEKQAYQLRESKPFFK